MKKGIFGRIASLVLVLAMLIGAFTALAVTGSAEEASNVDKTAPEIVVKGPVDVWDKSTKTQPTTVVDGVTLITSAAEFAWFMSNLKGDGEDTNHYRLTTSIDLGRKKMSDSKYFAGILDGDGYTIQNWSNDGFQSFYTMSGTIKNLNITNIYVDEGGSKTTSFIRNLTGTVDNCHFQYGTFVVQRGGGIAHSASGNALISNTIVSCVEGGFMKDTYHMGAFVCDASGNAKFVNCVNYADIISTGADVRGGIVGNISSSAVRVENCVNYGDISTTGSSTSNNFTGGIIGKMNESAQDGSYFPVVGCINYGDVTITGSGYIGGIAGWINGAFNNKYSVYYVEFKNCVNHGTISAGAADFTGETAAGGLVGKCGRGLLVTNCINYGDVIATSSKGYAGGIVGIRSNQRSGNASLRIVSSTVQGSITSTNKAGGIAGQHNSDWCGGTSDEKNYYHGVHLTNVMITGTIEGTYVGGVLGYYTDGTYNTNTVLKGVILTSDIVNTGAETTAGALIGYSSYNRDAGKLCNSLTVTNDCYINDNGLAIANTATSTGVATADKNANYKPAEYNENGDQDGTFLGALNASASANATAPWVEGENGPELLTQNLVVNAANLELAGNLTMNFRMDASILPQGFNYTKVSLIANDILYVGELEGDNYYFAIGDIAASEMGKLRDYYVVVEITTGDVVASHKAFSAKSYSPMVYAQNISNSNDEAAVEVKGLLQAMVQYAYHADVLKNGASTIIDDYNAATGLALASDINYIPTIRDDVDASALNDFVTVSANLDSSVNLVFKANDGKEITSLVLQAGGGERTYTAKGEGYFEITDVHAGMLKNKLTITLIGAEGELVTATYSIGNYLDTVANSELCTQEQKNAAMAAAMYMLAVGQYQNPAYYAN